MIFAQVALKECPATKVPSGGLMPEKVDLATAAATRLTSKPQADSDGK